LTLLKSADTNSTEPSRGGADEPSHMKDVRDALMIAHNSEGKLVRRPLSPHLQVYTPQITSILSIMNRITGLAVSVGTLMLVWWLVAAATGDEAFARAQGFLGSPIGLFVLFGWTASLFYHFFGGLRHLAWDFGYGYDLPQTHMSGWAVVIATVVATVLTWAAGFWVLHR
jgi:succinate dehydrogenase / fumarate reductase, cytochrome b subunit